MNWRGLLVSVRDAAEAVAALEGGADIVDVKEPRRGPLGAADAAAAAAVARTVGSRVPWTMACGELSDCEAQLAAEPTRHPLRRVLDLLGPHDEPPAAVKVGLAGAAGTPWRDRLQSLWAAFPPGPERVAVAYADWRRAAAPDPGEVIAAGRGMGCRVVLVDTFDKSSAGIFGCCPTAAPAAWVAAARAQGMQVALAGRITLDQVPAAWSLGVDVVAVRSGVCWGGRDGEVRADLVRRAVAIGAAAYAQPPSSGVRT